MILGLTRPLRHHVQQQRMPAQWLGQPKFDPRKTLGQLCPCLTQIAANVDAGRQKIWQQDHALRPLRHAMTTALLDARLGQFQKRRLDNRLAACAQAGDDMMEVRVRLLLPTAVGDEQQRRLHEGVSSRMDNVLPIVVESMG